MLARVQRVVVLSLIMASLPTLVAAQAGGDSIITVTSMRSIQVAPDAASLYVTVEGTAETSGAALALAESKLASVLDALRGVGSGIKLGPPIVYSVGPTPGPRDYPGAPAVGTLTARTAVRVDVNSLADLARVYTAATDAGAAGLSSPSFSSSAVDSVSRAEVGEAIARANEEAAAIAAALGGRISGAVSVSRSGNQRPFMQPTTLPPNSNFGQPLFAPEIDVNVSVTVRFRFVR